MNSSKLFLNNVGEYLKKQGCSFDKKNTEFSRAISSDVLYRAIYTNCGMNGLNAGLTYGIDISSVNIIRFDIRKCVRDDGINRFESPTYFKKSLFKDEHNETLTYIKLFMRSEEFNVEQYGKQICDGYKQMTGFEYKYRDIISKLMTSNEFGFFHKIEVIPAMFLAASDRQSAFEYVDNIDVSQIPNSLHKYVFGVREYISEFGFTATV